MDTLQVHSRNFNFTSLYKPMNQHSESSDLNDIEFDEINEILAAHNLNPEMPLSMCLS